MPTFKAPIYSKQVNSKTGLVEPSYVFAIEFMKSDETLSFIAYNQSDISLSTLQNCINEDIVWWNTFMNAFLQSSVKLFSKPYTVEHINKITKHVLNGTAQNEFPINVVLLPTSIQISGGIFLVHWKYACEPIVIDMISIPDSECPVLNEIIDGVEELSIDNVPMDKNATDKPLNLNSPEQFYDRQRVKEARLKAKLALYNAQNQAAKYYEKYGDDTWHSDTDSEDEDDEVQL
jgi:hypothetical protein